MFTTSFIARIAGLRAEDIGLLASNQILTSLHVLSLADSERRAHFALVDSALHGEVGKIDSKQTRNRLLEIRRNLREGRLVSSTKVASLGAFIGVQTAELILKHQELIARFESTKAMTAATYEAEAERTRQIFKSLVLDKNFQLALHASTPSLFQNIRRYCSTPSERRNARLDQIERGLLKYFSRAAMKATPFSRFCAIVCGRFEEGSTPLQGVQGATGTMRGYVRLDKSLFSFMWENLKRHPAVLNCLSVELAPTLTSDKTHYRFLASVDGREVFQSLARSVPVDAAIDAVREVGKHGFAVITQRLASDPDIDASVEEAEGFLQSLIALGACNLSAVVADQDADWDIPLARFLNRLDDSMAQAFARLLEDLRHAIGEYQADDISVRIDVGARIEEVTKSMLEALSLTGRPRRTLPLFEDATLNEELVMPRSDAVQRMLSDVELVGRSLDAISGRRAVQATMREYFNRKYGEAKRVPLLRFYEDYYRDFFKSNQDKQRRQQQGRQDDDLKGYSQINPLGVPAIDQWRAAANRLTERFQTLWREDPRAVEVSMRIDEFLALIGAEGRPSSEHSSLASFCQVLFDDSLSIWRCVLTKPSFVPGYGKYYSRFLYMLPAEFASALRERNARGQGTIVAEIAGDAAFNANLHPPLFDFEVTHPNGVGSTDTKTVSALELDVVVDEGRPWELCLEHRKTNMPVVPIDLGFLNILRRPPLYQLLASFAPVGSTNIPLPESARFPRGTPTSQDQEPGAQLALIEYRPRLAIGDHLVVARRRWSVPHVLFPTLTAGESRYEYFAKANRWRESVGIPESVYVRVQPIQSRKLPESDPEVEGYSVDEASHTDEDSEFAGAIDAQRPEKTVPSSSFAGLRPSSERGMESSKGGNSSRRSKDHVKPQYVDFRSPLLVDLLSRLALGLPACNILVEECYPTEHQLATVGSQRYASELVLQFDRSPDVATESASYSQEAGDTANRFLQIV
jgi:hypothetical protein